MARLFASFVTIMLRGLFARFVGEIVGEIVCEFCDHYAANLWRDCWRDCDHYAANLATRVCQDCDHYAAKLDAAIGCGVFASFVTIMLPNWLPGSGKIVTIYAARFVGEIVGEICDHLCCPIWLPCLFAGFVTIYAANLRRMCWRVL